MCRAYNESRRFASLAVAAVDTGGEIQGLIAPVRVDVFPSMAKSFTSRAIMFGEPLCYSTEASTAAMQTLLRHHERNAKHDVLLTEVRSVSTAVAQCPILAGAGYKAKQFCNFVVDLELDENSLWRRIGKQMRGNIARSIRRDVRIETGNSIELCERAHRFIKKSLRRSVVPFPGVDLFLNVRKHLNDVLQVRVATHQGQDVAGSVSLGWDDRFYAWYGGTQRFKSIHPFACIVWDEIKAAREQGYRYYDFGGAGDPQQPYGPREFKSRFHGNRVEYGRCVRVYSPRILALAERGYRSFKHLTGAI